jgi:hypothetical protein
MTEKKLSPAAQAVLDAYQMSPIEDELTSAAVLRAVVEHCVPDDSEGHWVYIPHVLAIAKELEAK